MSGWTETQTIALLLEIIDHHIQGPIKWKDIRVPEGRTTKACMHKMEKLRAEVKSGGIALSAAPPSPRKDAGKKKGTGSHKFGNEDDEEVAHKPKAISAFPRKVETKVKQEGEDGDDGDNEGRTKKRKRTSTHKNEGNADSTKAEGAHN